jgi:hypothetical protein
MDASAARASDLMQPCKRGPVLVGEPAAAAEGDDLPSQRAVALGVESDRVDVAEVSVNPLNVAVGTDFDAVGGPVGGRCLPEPLTDNHSEEKRMESTSLTALADEQLAVARHAHSGRAAHTIHGGHDHPLRQTLLSLAQGGRVHSAV